MTRLILIRHGETDFNVAGRIQGHSDSELTAAGVEQAHAAAEALVNRRLGHVYSSDLKRARSTAQIIGDRLGLTVRLDPRLREMAFGQFEGRTWADLNQHYAALGAAGQGDWFTGVPPEGESRAALCARAVEALSEIALRHSGQTVGLVSHGGLIGVFLRRVLDLPTDRPYVGFRTRNCALHTFELRDDAFHLVTWGESHHLE